MHCVYRHVGRFAYRERLGGDNLRSEDRSQDGKDAKNDNGQVQQVVGEPVAAFFAEVLLLGKVNRQKRRRKKTARYQFVDDVRHVVRNLICRSDKPVAQGEGHRPRPNEARCARAKRRDGHQSSGAGDRSVGRTLPVIAFGRKLCAVRIVALGFFFHLWGVWFGVQCVPFIR